MRIRYLKGTAACRILIVHDLSASEKGSTGKTCARNTHMYHLHDTGKDRKIISKHSGKNMNPG